MRHVHSITLALLLALTARAADWPMYRGNPALTGVAAGSLPAKPALLWTFKTQGPVRSSAAIVGDRVYIGSNDGLLYALDFKTGKQLWTFKTDGPIESSPLVLDGRVYVGSVDALFYALDAATGKLLWKYATGDKIIAAANWFKTSNLVSLLVGSYDYKLHCLDAVTGKSNWVYETSNYINGSPAVANNQTVFGGCDGLLHILSLTDGSRIGSNDIGAPIAASVALDGDRAYFGHYENQFLCADLRHGTNFWAFRDREFPFFSSAAVRGDLVLFGGRDKLLHCVKRTDGQTVWTFTARGKVDSSPVVCGDKVVVGSDDGRLYLVRLNDGKELWSYEIGQPIEGSPAVANEKVVIGSDDGNVYCFGEHKK